MEKIKNVMCVFVVLAFSASLWADVNLTAFIRNPGFEQPLLFPGDSEAGLIGWQASSGRRAPATQNPGNLPWAVEGVQYAELYGSLCTQTVFGATVQPNTTYTLSADVAVYSTGNPRPDLAWFTMWMDAFESVERLAIFGSGLPDPNLYSLIEPQNPAVPTLDTWYTVSCSFDSSTVNPSVLGETIYIAMRGDYVKVDNIQLTATGTPVNLTINAVDPNAVVLVPMNGAGDYEVGDGWTVPLDAAKKFTVCPTLYTFSSWTGADTSSENTTTVTMAGDKTVTIAYTTSTVTCSYYSVPPITVANPSFETPFVGGSGSDFTGEEDSFGYVGDPGNTQTSVLPGWLLTGNRWGYVWNPDGTGINHWDIDVGLIDVSDGVAALGSWGKAGHAFGVYQNTGARAQVGDIITLYLDLNNLSNDYVVGGINYGWLLAYIQFVGGTPASLTLNPAGAPYDEWRTVSLQTTVTEENAGKDIQILLQGAGVWVDNVRLERQTYGYPATLTIATSPAGVGVTPEAGIYQMSLGTVVNVVAPVGYVACPNTYSFEEWTSVGRSLSRPQVRNQTLLLDDDLTITAEYNQNVPVCGDVCHPIPDMDFSGNCIVNLDDFAIFAETWVGELGDFADFVEQWLTDTRP